jgi:hypothetical protein
MPCYKISDFTGKERKIILFRSLCRQLRFHFEVVSAWPKNTQIADIK